MFYDHLLCFRSNAHELFFLKAEMKGTAINSFGDMWNQA